MIKYKTAWRQNHKQAATTGRCSKGRAHLKATTARIKAEILHLNHIDCLILKSAGITTSTPEGLNRKQLPC